MGTRTILYINDEATKQAAKDALNCQDGCNMLAIVNAFHRHMQATKTSKVKSEHGEHDLDGDSRNQHPAFVLFADKLAQLADVQSIGTDRYAKSYFACKEILEGKDVTLEVKKL